MVKVFVSFVYFVDVKSHFSTKDTKEENEDLVSFPDMIGFAPNKRIS